MRLVTIVALVKKRKPYLAEGIRTALRTLKPLVAVAAFGFIVSERLAFLQQSLD